MSLKLNVGRLFHEKKSLPISFQSRMTKMKDACHPYNHFPSIKNFNFFEPASLQIKIPGYWVVISSVDSSVTQFLTFFLKMDPREEFYPLGKIFWYRNTLILSDFPLLQSYVLKLSLPIQFFSDQYPLF